MSEFKLSNRIMFAIVMQDETLCKQFIERLFPERKVKKISVVTTEKAIITGIKSKSVRLDVMFEGDDQVYDVEMQVTEEKEIAKRTRYYHSAIDRQILNAGENYEDLREAYVIFICLYDPFNLGEPIYQFQMVDINLGLKLNDGCNTIILNTTCPSEKVPCELRPFFEYVSNGELEPSESDEFVLGLHEKVEEVNLDEEVCEIMTVEQEINLWKNRADKAYDEGERAAKKETARKMSAKGIPSDTIAEITGLSPDEYTS